MDGAFQPPMPQAQPQAQASPCPPADASAVVLRRTITIRNSRGLHARAAAKLVTLAEKHCACLNLTHDGQTVPARSIMGLMLLGAGKGATVTLEAEGWDAREALDEVAGLIEAGFGED